MTDRAGGEHRAPGPSIRILNGLLVASAGLAVADEIIVSATVETLAVVPAWLAVTIALVVARRHVAGAAWLMAGASTVFSILGRLARSNPVGPVLGLELGPRARELTGLTVPLLTELFGISVLAGLAVWTAGPRRAILVLVALYVSLILMASWRLDLGNVGVVGVTAPFVIGAVLGGWMRNLDEEREMATHAARQDERLALARDLHDLTAHHMAGIALHAQAAQLHLDDDPDTARTSLVEIERSVRDALASVRSVVGSLREGPAERAPAPDVSDLKALETAANGNGPEVRMAVAPAATTLPGPVLTALHRVALEVIANARRHATGATHVAIRIDVERGQAVIDAVDDGRPSGGMAHGGFGLVGIEERVAALGGSVTYGPSAAGGWRLVGRIPIEWPREQR
jgi:signal transduction histidine kinase